VSGTFLCPPHIIGGQEIANAHNQELLYGTIEIVLKLLLILLLFLVEDKDGSNRGGNRSGDGNNGNQDRKFI
jgi:hypothetical protein